MCSTEIETSTYSSPAKQLHNLCKNVKILMRSCSYIIQHNAATPPLDITVAQLLKYCYIAIECVYLLHFMYLLHLRTALRMSSISFISGAAFISTFL